LGKLLGGDDGPWLAGTASRQGRRRRNSNPRAANVEQTEAKVAKSSAFSLSLHF
jgi:hypothetical protein